MSSHPLPSLEVPALEHVIVPVGCNTPGVSTQVNRMLTKRCEVTQHPVVPLPLRPALAGDLDEALIE